MARITDADLENIMLRMVRSLEALELPCDVELLHGSKYYGNSFQLRRKEGRAAVGVDAGGFLGWTKSEAYEAIGTIARTLEDVSYYRSQL